MSKYSKPIRRVLITGASSFIGGHIARHLACSGLEVIGTYQKSICNLQHIAASYRNLTVVQLDISKWSEFYSLPSKIDAVFHLAAISPISGSSIDDTLNVNGLGTRNVQRYAKQAKAQKFVYASSLSVYGGIAAGIVDEQTLINAPDIYGASKYLGERILADKDNVIPTIAIRLPGVLGRGAHRAWIPNIVDKLIAGIDISVYNPQSRFNNAIHVEDLGRFAIQILDEQNWDGFHSFPVGAAGAISIVDVVKLLRRELNSVSTLSVVDVEKPSFQIDSTYAMKNFGYSPTPIEFILKRYMQDILKK